MYIFNIINLRVLVLLFKLWKLTNLDFRQILAPFS